MREKIVSFEDEWGWDELTSDEKNAWLKYSEGIYSEEDLKTMRFATRTPTNKFAGMNERTTAEPVIKVWNGKTTTKEAIDEWKADLSKMLNDNAVVSLTDMVNHPPHYEGLTGKIESIDAIKEAMPNWQAWLGWLKGNAMKYLWRYEHKKAPLEDLKKAQFFVNKLVEEYEELQA